MYWEKEPLTYFIKAKNFLLLNMMVSEKPRYTKRQRGF